jgi:hypothetical protein
MDAERRAADAQRERDAARGEVTQSQLANVQTGLAAAQAAADAAEARYKTAYEAGDAGAMAKAQREMARAEAEALRLEESKADLEVRKEAKPERTEAPSDSFEAYLANRTESTKTWLRAHRDWVEDPKKNVRLTAAHWDAVAEGHQPDTAEYFAHVETKIGLKQAASANANGSANGSANGQQQPTRRRETVPVAPVQHSGGGTSGNGTQVRLSKGEAAAATDGTHVWLWDDPKGKFKKGEPIGVQEFARRKLEMQRSGAYDRSYTEQ